MTALGVLGVIWGLVITAALGALLWALRDGQTATECPAAHAEPAPADDSRWLADQPAEVVRLSDADVDLRFAQLIRGLR